MPFSCRDNLTINFISLIVLGLLTFSFQSILVIYLQNSYHVISHKRLYDQSLWSVIKDTIVASFSLALGSLLGGEATWRIMRILKQTYVWRGPCGELRPPAKSRASDRLGNRASSPDQAFSYLPCQPGRWLQLCREPN